MIERISQQGREAAAAVDEEFLSLICADEDLLRAEFQSIIAAAWGARPTYPRRPCAPTPRAGLVPQAESRGLRDLTLPPPRPAIDGRARQRSPPPR